MGTKTITTVLIGLMLIAAFAVGYYVYTTQQQAKLQAAQLAQQQAQTVAQAQPTTSLAGKPATISVYSIDKGQKTDTKLASRLFLVTDPVVTADSITGNFAADGTTLSSSARTDVTSGITVGKKYAAVASNNTYFGFPSAVKTVGDAGEGQAELLDLESYTTTGSLSINMRTRSTDTANLVNGGGTKNFTLTANDATTMNKIWIKQNMTNRAFNFAGFYLDKPVNTNISDITKTLGYTPGTGKENPDFADGPNLKFTEADDIIFELTTPILLKEYDEVTLTDAIKFQADGDGCTADPGEDTVFYAFDKIWTKSSIDSNKIIYAIESDSTTPADVGMSNPSFTINCASV